jgi:hypothetical protein
MTMTRLALPSLLVLSAFVSSTSAWAVDGVACLKTLMRWSGDTFVIAAPTGAEKPSQEYQKRPIIPTSVCRELGVQSVEIGTQGQKVLFAQIKWKASRNMPILESLPVGIQGAISAQNLRAPDMQASHTFVWREFSSTSFTYSLNRQPGQYQETVTWGAEPTPNEQ